MKVSQVTTEQTATTLYGKLNFSQLIQEQHAQNIKCYSGTVSSFSAMTLLVGSCDS